MLKQIGHIKAMYRYPVKSMAGESVEHIALGWHGFEGDRRFAFNIVHSTSGFPWLTGTKLPKLLLYQPIQQGTSDSNDLPTHVVTPNGETFDIRSDELRQEITTQFGADVRIMQLKQGIFDEAAISMISLATTRKIANGSNTEHDVRRFRPNIVIDTLSNAPFIEDEWVENTVVFGDSADSPAIQITMRDERCMMVNLQPDTVASDPNVMKTVVKQNGNCAGVYASVVQIGQLELGQPVYLK